MMHGLAAGCAGRDKEQVGMVMHVLFNLLAPALTPGTQKGVYAGYMLQYV